MKLDILVLAAHPDDAELGCGATIAKHVDLGYKVGIVDFTRGELGTRGTVASRQKEAKASAAILGLSARENLGFQDGFFQNDPPHQKKTISVIRKYRPDLVWANAVYDRHPDHGRAADLAVTSCFLSGLKKIETRYRGHKQSPWRPKAIYHYIQSIPLKPDIVVDVSAYWEKKKSALKAFTSQFYNPDSDEPDTYISSPQFMKMIEARGVELGHVIGAQYGEGFTVRRTVGVDVLTDLC